MENNVEQDSERSSWQSSSSSSSQNFRGTKTTNNMDNCSRRSLQYYQTLEKSINEQAKKMTVEYIKR